MTAPSFVAVLPSRVRRMTAQCVRTMAPEFRERLAIIDNTKTNRGVPYAWNRGIAHATEHDAAWLIIVSAGVRFGPWGGLDLVEACADHPREIAVEADRGLGWHLIALNMDAVREVGPFDEQFFPAYYEENDWSYRAFCRYGLDPAGPWWPKVPTDAQLFETAHAIKRADTPVDYEANLARYVSKHGGEPGAERFRLSHGVCPKCFDVWEHCGCRRGR